MTKGSRGKLAEAAVTTTTGLVRSGVTVKRGPVCAVVDKQLLSKTPHAKRRQFFTGELGATCLPSRSGPVAVPETKRKTLKRHGLLETSPCGNHRKERSPCRLLPELVCLLLALTRPLRLAGGTVVAAARVVVSPMIPWDFPSRYDSAMRNLVILSFFLGCMGSSALAAIALFRSRINS